MYGVSSLPHHVGPDLYAPKFLNADTCSLGDLAELVRVLVSHENLANLLCYAGVLIDHDVLKLGGVDLTRHRLRQRDSQFNPSPLHRFAQHGDSRAI